MERPQRRRIRLDPSVYGQPGRAFSVTIGTSPRAPIFTDLELGLACVGQLRFLAADSSTRVWAYCLMPDHVHLLLQVGATPLGSFVQAWKSRCYRLRRARGNPEPFWQRSFFDHALRSEEDLRRAAGYILANPVRKGLVKDTRAYPLAGSLILDPWPDCD